MLPTTARFRQRESGQRLMSRWSLTCKQIRLYQALSPNPFCRHRPALEVDGCGRIRTFTTNHIITANCIIGRGGHCHLNTSDTARRRHHAPFVYSIVRIMHHYRSICRWVGLSDSANFAAEEEGFTRGFSLTDTSSADSDSF